MFSKPCIMVKAFKVWKLLVSPPTLAKQHYHHIPKFQRSVNTTHLSFIISTWSCGDNLVLERGKDGTTQTFPLCLTSEKCCHLAVQLLIFWKVQACQRKEQMTEPFFFLIGIRSMQGWTATMRHGVTRKEAQKRLQNIENLFRKNLQLKDVC